MSKKRTRYIRLIYDLVLDLAAVLFGLVGLSYVGYHYFAPGLRDQPFESSLEGSIGHAGTFLVFLAFSILMLIVGLVFTWRTARLLRSKAYLEGEEPPFNPSR